MLRLFSFVALVLLVDGQTTIAPVFAPIPFTSTGPVIAPVATPPITAAPTVYAPILPSTVAPVVRPSTTPPVAFPTVPTPTAPTVSLPPIDFTLPPILALYTPPPAGFPVCNVCGEGYTLVNRTAETKLGDTNYTCSEVEEGGLRQLIPTAFCNPLIEQVARDCGCSENILTGAPSVAPQVVDTKAPASGSSVIQGLFGSLIGVLSFLLL